MAFNFDIPSLRRQSLMQGYDQPTQDMGGGYDWTQPNVDYSAGDMPQMQVNMPPPSVGPVQDTPFPGMFGREYTPSMTGAQPTGPTQGAPPSQVAPPQVNTYDPDRANRDMMEAIGRVYTPETVDRDRLRGLMDAAPERERPGWGRGLSAIALGIGSKSPEEGLKAQEAVLFAPHRRAMADWTAKADPFYKTAQLENQANVNERTLAGNVVKSVSDDRRLEQTRIRDEGKQQVAEERNRIAGIVAEANVARANKWDVKIDGDRVIAISPDGQQMRTIGSSRGMTTEDKIRLEGQYRVAAAAEAAKAGQTRAEIGQTREFTDKEGNVWIQKPGSPAEKTDLPPGSVPSAAPRAGAGGGQLEKNRVEQDVLGNIWERDKESARHIRNDGNKFAMKPRPEIREDNPYWPGDQSITQKDVDTWDAIKKESDPSYVPPKPKTAAAPAPPAAARPAAPKQSFPELNVNKPPTDYKDPFKTDPTAGIKGPTFSGAPTKGVGPSAIVPKGRIQIFKNGKPAGTISNNPAIIQQAIGRGYTIEG